MTLLQVDTLSIDSVGYKPGVSFPVKADVAFHELRRIAQTVDPENETLKPIDVIEASRNDEAVLHEIFEWDDPTAANYYRDSQARHLIRSVVVVFRDEQTNTMTEPIRYFVHVNPKKIETEDDENYQTMESAGVETEPDDIAQKHIFIPIKTVMADEDLRNRFIEQALRELKSWRKRYGDISDFAKVFKEIDRLLK